MVKMETLMLSSNYELKNSKFRSQTSNNKQNSRYKIQITKLQNSSYKIQIQKFKKSNSNYKTQITKFKLQNSNNKIQITKFKFQVIKFKLQNSITKLQITKVKLQNSNYKIQITKFKLQLTCTELAFCTAAVLRAPKDTCSDSKSLRFSAASARNRSKSLTIRNSSSK